MLLNSKLQPHRGNYLFLWWLVFALFFLALHRPAVAQLDTSQKNRDPIILAAANVRPVLDEIAQSYSQQTSKRIKIIYGSSGNFYQQIVNGGKFDLFISADENFVIKLRQENFTKNDGVIYAQGQLSVWIAKKYFFEPITLQDLKTRIASANVSKIALANPSLAPYGKASEQVLRNWVNWSQIQNKIIMGENVGQVAQFALSGSVQLAFLPTSLALNMVLQQSGYVVPVPANLHDPIVQRMVLLSDQPVAQDFYQFMIDKQNKKIWEKYGYIVP